MICRSSASVQLKQIEKRVKPNEVKWLSWRAAHRIPTDELQKISKLTGAAGFHYLLQSSTNLVNWTPSAWLLNTNGTVLFTDSSATHSAQRFSRALLP